MFWPIKWALPSSGMDLMIIPTVFGDKCRFSSQSSFALPLISRTSFVVDTVPALNTQNSANWNI
jgi:hypothetical protein